MMMLLNFNAPIIAASAAVFEVTDVKDLESWIKETYRKIQHSIYTILTYSKGDTEQVERMIRILQDYVWEKLNVGHWRDVHLVWRQLYSNISLFKVIVLALEAKTSPAELVKICDNGVLMGYPVLDNMLAKIANQLHILNSSSAKTLEAPNSINTGRGDASDASTNSLGEAYLPHKIVSLPGPRLVVPTEKLPSIELFAFKYFKAEAPVLLHGITDSWSAMRKWSPEYIKKIAGSRTVPVEIGSKYTDDDWTQKLITIEEFVDIYMKESGGSNPVGYVAQHQLFEQIPGLMEDIRIPEYCCLGTKKDVEVNAWFGPAGTMTPTHYDPNHNLLAQVFGTKFVRLFPPSEALNLYPNSPDSLLFNTSQIDLEDISVCEKFPRLRSASYADVLLTPGSVLYIPPKWWHMVKSLSPSFSCSFWFE